MSKTDLEYNVFAVGNRFSTILRGCCCMGVTSSHIVREPIERVFVKAHPHGMLLAGSLNSQEGVGVSLCSQTQEIQRQKGQLDSSVLFLCHVNLE